MIKPQVNTEPLEMADPTFEAGVVKTARAVLTNPTTKSFTYTVELYLGVTRAATSGSGQVAIGAGGAQTVYFTLATPSLEGEYEVYLDVWVGTELIAHRKATENVIIQISPQVDIGDITWE